MSRDAVYNEAELILAAFPEFWAVDENIYHLYGIVEKTGLKRFTVEVVFPADYPATPPELRVSQEISTLLGGTIDLRTLASWHPGSSRVVDVLKELKILVQKHLEDDFLELKPAPKEGVSKKDYADFSTPEPFEFHGGVDERLDVKPVSRPAGIEIIEEPGSTADDVEVFIPENKRWVEIDDSAASTGGTLHGQEPLVDESYWDGAGSAGTGGPATTGDPARDAALQEQADMIMMEYSIDQPAPGQVNVYLTISIEDTFIIPVDFSNHPARPAFDFPPQLAPLLPDPTRQLATLREWDPAMVPNVIDVIRELEGRLWALNDIETRVKRIFGEFEASYEPGSKTAVRVTILTYGFQEFHITMDLKGYPARPAIRYSPNLAALIRTPPERLKVMENWDNMDEKEPVAILREINWLVDKESRMAFEIELVTANLKETRYDPVTRTIHVKMKGTMKTEERVFEFKADLPENYPMAPPAITMTSKLDDEEESMAVKMNAALKGLLGKWVPASSYLIDAFNAVSKAIFEVSVISCIICHKFECPSCSTKLDSSDINEGTCKVVCPYCERAYHKHCWDQTIATFSKCGFCLRPPPPNMMP